MRLPVDKVRGAIAGLVAGLAFLAVPGAWAATADPNETCLACHGDKDAGKHAKSVHGQAGLECTACHADVSAKKLPHAEKLKPVDCATCHEKPVADYRATVHGMARKGGSTAAATCVDCHGKHDILRSKDSASRTSHANVEATCAACHGKEAMRGQAKMPGGAVAKTFHDSIHGRALAGAARGSAPTCNNCHGSHDIRGKANEKSRVHRANIPDTCGSCHTKEREHFGRGQHGKLRQEGNLAAPGCTDCHSAHDIQPHSAPSFQAAVIKECGNCHADYASTYRDTFHGQVTSLGYTRMATCASCHGSHEILPASNPASKISPQNRLKTCQQCHAGATANFAEYDPHASKHDPKRNFVYYWTAKLMGLLLLGVFTFFGIHTVLWFYRSLREKLARGKPPGGGKS
jgi:hypothetical protein